MINNEVATLSVGEALSHLGFGVFLVDADARMLGLVKPVSVAVNGDAREAAAEIARRLASGNIKLAAHGTRERRLEEVAAVPEVEDADADRPVGRGAHRRTIRGA